MNINNNTKFVRVNDVQPSDESHIWYTKSPGAIVQVQKVTRGLQAEHNMYEVINPLAACSQSVSRAYRDVLYMKASNFTELDEIQVTITQDTGDSGCWYANRIGETFTVSTTRSNGMALLKDQEYTGDRYIYPQDCELVQDSNKNQTQPTTVQSVRDQIEKLQVQEKELIAEEKAKEAAKVGRFKPRAGEAYYYLASYGHIAPGRFAVHHGSDVFRVSTGNAFPTQEAAQAHKDKLLAIAQVNDIIEELNGDWVPNVYLSDGKYLQRDMNDSSFYYDDGLYDSCSLLVMCKCEHYEELKARITQDQIKAIWGK